MRRELLAAMAQAGARLTQAGAVSPGEGNLSVRIGQDSFLVTVSGCDKRRLGGDDLVTVRLDQDKIPHLASRETRLHREIYRRRGDVHSIVHAHPKKVLELAARGIEPAQGLLAGGGEPPSWLPPLEPGSLALALAAGAALADSDCCILSEHGVVTVAGSMEVAVDRLLRLERLAAEVMH